MGKIKFLGTKTKFKYHGWDFENNAPVHFVKGEIGKVSDKMEIKLLADFPEEFVKIEKRSVNNTADREKIKKELDELGVKYFKNTSTKKLMELLKENKIPKINKGDENG